MRIDHAKRLVLYDFYSVPGGAEHVTEIVSQLLDAAIVVGSKSSRSFLPTSEPWQSALSLGPYFENPVARALTTIRAFRSCRFHGVDTAFVSGYYAAAALPALTNSHTIYYCHALPRYAFDLYSYYRERLPALARPFFAAFCSYIRSVYRESITSADVVLCNSKNVQARLQKYLGVSAQVVYPPCVTPNRPPSIRERTYYVSTARLEPYKRVSTIIESFGRMPGRELVVTSGGSQRHELEQLAKGCPNITFTGWLPSDDLAKYVAEAAASIYIPVDEDFGLSPVESMSLGTPVIAAACGGILETVVDGETGILVPEPVLPEHIIRAVEESEKLHHRLSTRSLCRARAQRFSLENFQTSVSRFF